MKSKEVAFKDNLKFYHTFFQFNPPYPILMDGSFICSIIANGVSDIFALMNSIYGSRCELFTTNCVVFNLECNFPNNYQIQAITEKLQIYECTHSYSNPKCMYTCVTEVAETNRYKKVIGHPIEKHYVQGTDPRFILASQNISVLETLRKVVGVPLLYFKRGNVYLEKPGTASLEWVRANKLKSIELLDIEREILQRSLVAAEAKKPEVEIQAAKCTQRKRKKGESSHDSEKEADKHSSFAMKRGREPSPDICDLPRHSSSSGSSGLKSKQTTGSNSVKPRFEIYKTLYRESDSTGHRLLGRAESLRGKTSARVPSMAPTPLWTNTSSFEFDLDQKE